MSKFRTKAAYTDKLAISRGRTITICTTSLMTVRAGNPRSRKVGFKLIVGYLRDTLLQG